MDFFSAQEQARRNSALLIFLFALAVVVIVIAVYLAVLLVTGNQPSLAMRWRFDIFAPVALSTLLLIGGGSAYKIAALAKGGGASVAELLGGRLISRGTSAVAERRLLNIVDEMAIASGVAVPRVYVMDAESAINAFAAGNASNTAVIAVTRGSLEHLSRDELQGVIAHEFSHILNGDMRLNLRIMGILHGILLLALLGRGMLRGAGRSRGRNTSSVALFGLALLLIGWVGVFFGRLIKAAVSRQREFLADASAVQFTRNPGGIAGALKKIGGFAGSRIEDSQAEEASHLFFGEGVGSLFGWFATHPPLAERIRRLDSSFDLDLAAGAAKADILETAGSGMDLQPGVLAAAAAKVSALHVAYARHLIAALPPSISVALGEATGARSIIYCLLMSADPAISKEQLAMVTSAEGDHMRKQIEAHLDWIRGAGPRLRLPLVDLALPLVRESTLEEQQRFLEISDQLIRADRRLDLFEYALQRILVRHVGAGRRHLRPRRTELREIARDSNLLLSCLAYVGSSGEAASAAFAAAVTLGPFDGPWEMVPREAVDLRRLDEALNRLATLVPRFKRRLVEACAAAVAHDGKVTTSEGELLRAICEMLEVPMPPLLVPRSEAVVVPERRDSREVSAA